MDPIELLSGHREPTFLSKYFNPAVAGVLGFGAMCVVNWGTRRPLLSGIQQHILAAAIGVGAGGVLDKYRNDYLADRDATLRHYIELHREDFPTPDRKKWGQILVPWVPIR